MHGQTVCRHGTMHYTVHVSSAERLRAYGGHRGPWELYMGPSDTVQRVLWTVPWGVLWELYMGPWGVQMGSFGGSKWVIWGHLGSPGSSFRGHIELSGGPLGHV